MSKLTRCLLLGFGECIAGAVMNNIVIAANDGHMPYMPSPFTHFRHPITDPLYVLASPSTKWPLLIDRIPIGHRSLASMGDVLLFTGMAVIIVILAVLLLTALRHPSKAYKAFMAASFRPFFLVGLAGGLVLTVAGIAQHEARAVIAGVAFCIYAAIALAADWFARRSPAFARFWHWPFKIPEGGTKDA